MLMLYGELRQSFQQILEGKHVFELKIAHDLAEIQLQMPKPHMTCQKISGLIISIILNPIGCVSAATLAVLI